MNVSEVFFVADVVEWLKTQFYWHSLNSYRGYLYKSTGGFDIDYSCAVACATDPDDRCEFSVRHGANCYFGDFDLGSQNIMSHTGYLWAYISRGKAPLFQMLASRVVKIFNES